MPTTDHPGQDLSELDLLSPFQLKDELIRYARDHVRSGSAVHTFLNAGRGNPNWIATTPRESFFVLGQFGLEEARRVWSEDDLGGMPDAEGIAERLAAFLDRMADGPGVTLLRRAVDYAVSELGLDADKLVYELTDAIIGDNYPQPDRMLVHVEVIVRRFLEKVMCDDRPPPGKLDLFAVEGGTAAMCYVFESLMESRILHRGDTIAIGTPIFTPYIELPKLDHFGLTTVEIEQSEMGKGGRHLWQYTDEQIAKLEDPRIKALFIVNPSNPPSFAMAADTQRRIVQLVRTKRPDLIILTDDVYGTFIEGFRSLVADLPHNTVLVYSFSKHFGCTGWRLGVVAMHEDNVLDRQLAALPEADREHLHERYRSLSTTPDQIKFIDRLVADSRQVALNHTAGLSTPQQVQMALFALFTLLDHDDAYTNRCRTLVRQRFARLMAGLGVEMPEDPLRVGYYAELDLEAWGRAAIGDDFVDYMEQHHDPTEVVIELARRYGSVLLNGGGFDGPPWSVRVSLANLDADAYEAIGRDLRELVMSGVERWRQTQRSH